MKKILSFLRDRVKEGSTWIGGTLLVILGVNGDVAYEGVDLFVQILSFALMLLPDKAPKAVEGTNADNG